MKIEFAVQIWKAAQKALVANNSENWQTKAFLFLWHRTLLYPGSIREVNSMRFFLGGNKIEQVVKWGYGWTNSVCLSEEMGTFGCEKKLENATKTVFWNRWWRKKKLFRSKFSQSKRKFQEFCPLIVRSIRCLYDVRPSSPIETDLRFEETNKTLEKEAEPR